MKPRSQFPRGFKIEALTIARDIRADLKLSPAHPLDPQALADFLSIPILSLSAFRTDARSAYRAFSGRLRTQFSAVTVFDGPSRVIVHNDHHAPQRQRSNLAHELAHALLFHEPTPAINDRGAREWDSGLEAQASWLSAVLLVPDDAALRIVRQQLTVKDAAREYGVSELMMDFRIRACAARRRVERSTALMAHRNS